MTVNIVDLATLIASIASIVAIVISVRTVRSQNRVALFEKRYEVYSELNKILEIGRRTKAVGREVRLNAQQAWSTILVLMNWEDGELDEIRSRRIKSEVIIEQTRFLYHDVDFQPIERLFETFRAYVENTYKIKAVNGVMWEAELREEPGTLEGLYNLVGGIEIPEGLEDVLLQQPFAEESGQKKEPEAWITDFFDACSGDAMRLLVEEEMKRTLHLVNR